MRAKRIVTAMTQRRTMREAMMEMQDGMMGRMMAHMPAGSGSMTMCPMMKPMSGMNY